MHFVVQVVGSRQVWAVGQEYWTPGALGVALVPRVRCLGRKAQVPRRKKQALEQKEQASQQVVVAQP